MVWGAQGLQKRSRVGIPRRIQDDLKEMVMNWDRIEGNWKQFKGKVKEQWGKLTDDELDQMAGKRTQLAGKLQERYGIAKDEAERRIDAWLDRQSDRIDRTH